MALHRTFAVYIVDDCWQSVGKFGCIPCHVTSRLSHTYTHTCTYMHTQQPHERARGMNTVRMDPSCARTCSMTFHPTHSIPFSHPTVVDVEIPTQAYINMHPHMHQHMTPCISASVSRGLDAIRMRTLLQRTGILQLTCQWTPVACTWICTMDVHVGEGWYG